MSDMVHQGRMGEHLLTMVQRQRDEIDNCARRSSMHLNKAASLLESLDAMVGNINGNNPPMLMIYRAQLHLGLGRACNERAQMLIQGLQGSGPLQGTKQEEDEG